MDIQPDDASTPVLSVQNLTTSFKVGGVWTSVVRNLSFDIAPRQTTAIVGESGSGKSVTSLSIMRLLQKDVSRIEGRVVLGQSDLLSLSDKAMRQVRGKDISMIFQEPMTSLNPVFPIGRQIAEAITCHRKISAAAARKEALHLLEKVRISSASRRLDEYPHELSGGMRQRVMIAMALASRPRLLIADEPTTALDVTIQGQILDLIKTLQDETGMSVLFITHDMGVVAEVADRTVVMFRGESVEAGSTERIFRSPEHPYTRALLSAVPNLGSMQGKQLPLSFPVIDIASGTVKTEAAEGSRPLEDTPPVLSVRNLTTRFEIRSGMFGRSLGSVHAVENVSLDLKPGETLALVGESGCGKSTTGRSIMRLVEPNAGEIRLDGRDVTRLGKRELRDVRRNIQMIFQDPFASLNPRMQIGAAIMEPFIAHGLGTPAQAHEKAAGLLERVGLQADMMKRFAHEFSGGQRQRIAIARALMLDPKVIVADEAVSALDVSIKAQVCNLLLELQETFGIAFLFISHDMAIVERVSHTVAVMYLGEIVEKGPRQAIFEDPRHEYTRTLISAVPSLDPGRRNMRRDASTRELVTPLRPRDYVPPRRAYAEVSPGHFVISP